MPATVKTARFIMTLDVAFGLVGPAFPLVALAATFDVIVLLLLLLAYSTAVTALTGWVLARWPTRRRRLVWTAVALELLLPASRRWFNR
jgi:hypothetical protein